jgi:concanavalin A-like lectin/glucanase superfamily protein
LRSIVIAFVVAPALLFAPAAVEADSTGLVAQWHLDEVTGGATPDSSGNGLTGDEVSGTLVPGRFGSALSTPNNNDGFRVPANPLLEPQGITVMAWVNKGAPFNVFRTIVSKGSDTCGIRESYALDTGPDGGLRFLAYQGGSSVASVANDVAPASIWNGQWHAVAGTFDGTTVRLYLDGVQVGSAPAPVPGGVIQYGLPEPRLSVARFPQDGPCDPNGFQFRGAIDEVRLYRRALSAAEVGYLQNAAATVPPSLPIPGAGGGGGATGPVASFTSPGKVAPLKLAILNAGATTGASKLVWDINGDGRGDVSCGASTPMLGVRLRSAQTASVRLTAIALDGRSSQISQPLSISGPSVPRGKVPSTFSDVAICGSTTGYIEGALQRQNLPALSNGISCAVQSTVTFSVVEASGCFDHVLSEDAVPAAERAVVTHYYDLESLPKFVQAACAQNPTGKACKDFLTEFGALDLFVSHHTVKIDGMSFTPRGNGSIVLFPTLQRVVSSNATVRLGGINVTSGAIDFDLRNPVHALGRAAPTQGRVPLFDVNPGDVGIGGFGIDGAIHLDLVLDAGRRFTEATLRVDLPAVFDSFGGSPPSGSVTAQADNTTNGLVLDRLHLAVPEADIGGLRFTNVGFDYAASGSPDRSCPKDWWKATARVFLDGAGFILSPPPSQNGIEFCAGADPFFRSAGGAIQFGGPIPAPQLFPGVFLDVIGFDVALDPTLVRGTATISAAELSQVSGTLLLGFPSPGSPYTLSPEDAKSPGNGDVGDLAPLAGRTLVSPFVALGGTASLRIPGLDQGIDFGNGYVLYSFPDYIALGGGVRVVMPGFTVNGGLDGELSFRTKLFSLHGSIQACIAGLLCGGLEAWASNRGIVACVGDIRHGGLHPGIGYHWGDFWPTVWLVDGCTPSNYWITSVTGAADAAAAAQTFTVARGETAKNVRLLGAGGAPNVEVRGPDGETVSTATRTYVTSRTLAILRQDAGKVTWIGVNHGKPGRYTITLLPGSPRITGIAGTRPGSREIKATVTGSASRRTLRYLIASPGGERVAFFERAGTTFHLLGTARSRRGVIHFTPAPGRGGSREIVAQIQVDGVAAPDRTVGHYRASATVKTGNPRSLVVKRRRTALLISWRRVRGAIGYAIVIKQRSAAERVVKLAPGRHTARVAGIAKTQSGTVSVSARGPLLDWGRPSVARFTATKQPHTVLRPFSQLSKQPHKKRR